MSSIDAVVVGADWPNCFGNCDIFEFTTFGVNPPVPGANQAIAECRIDLAPLRDKNVI